MLKSKTAQLLEKIVHDKFDDMGLCFGEEYSTMDIISLWQNLNQTATCSHGVSKVVFNIPEIAELGYVVKIPCTYAVSDDFDFYTRIIDDGDYFTHANSIFHNNNMINSITDSSLDNNTNEENARWDYCLTEARITNLIENSSIEKFFAKTYYLCDVHGYPIYIQEQMVGYTGCERFSEKTKERAKRYNSLIHNFENAHVALYFIENWGDVPELVDFLQFIEKASINDLHTGNMMYDSNGKLRLIDYSGFGE